MMQWKFCHYARQGQWCEPCLKRAVLSCKDFFLLQLCDLWLKCGANTLLEAPVCSWISQPFSDHIHPAICSQMRERNKDLLLSLEITNFLGHRREDFIYQSFPGLSDKHPGVGTTECCAPEGLHSSGSMSQWSLSLGTIVPWTKPSQPWLPSWYRLTYRNIAFEKQQAMTFSSKITLTNK